MDQNPGITKTCSTDITLFNMDSLGCSKVQKYKYFQEKMAAYISEILLFQLKMARLLSLSTNALYHWSHDFPRSEKFSDALYWPVSNLVCYWLLLHVIVIVLHHIGRFPILSGFVIVIACFCYCFSAYWLVSNLVCYLISPFSRWCCPFGQIQLQLLYPIRQGLEGSKIPPQSPQGLVGPTIL